MPLSGSKAAIINSGTQLNLALENIDLSSISVGDRVLIPVATGGINNGPLFNITHVGAWYLSIDGTITRLDKITGVLAGMTPFLINNTNQVDLSPSAPDLSSVEPGMVLVLPGTTGGLADGTAYEISAIDSVNMILTVVQIPNETNYTAIVNGIHAVTTGSSTTVDVSGDSPDLSGVVLGQWIQFGTVWRRVMSADDALKTITIDAAIDLTSDTTWRVLDIPPQDNEGAEIYLFPQYDWEIQPLVLHSFNLTQENAGQEVVINCCPADSVNHIYGFFTPCTIQFDEAIPKIAIIPAPLNIPVGKYFVGWREGVTFTGENLYPPIADRTLVAVFDDIQVDSGGSGSGGSGSGGNDEGHCDGWDVEVDHNFGGSLNLGLRSGEVWAYLKSDYVGGKYEVRDRVLTNADATWQAPMILDLLPYTLVFKRRGRIETTVDITPTVANSTDNCAGAGNISVNHNYGGTDKLRVTDQHGLGIDSADIIAYRAGEYDAGNYTRRARITTQADGRWVDSIHLFAGDYVILFRKDGDFRSFTKRITVA